MIQFCIEEAVMERLEVGERLQKARHAGGGVVDPSDEWEVQRAAHEELMARHNANVQAGRQ